MKWLSSRLCLLAVIAVPHAEALQITDDGRSIEGAFSPDGSQVAYLTVQKYYKPDGRYYFDGHLYVWDGRESRFLGCVPGGEPTVGDPCYSSGPGGTLAWLPRGEYVVFGDVRESKLFRIADGARTDVGRYKEWFVMNDDWELSEGDAAFVRHFMHSRARPLWLPPCTHMRRDKLPACVRRESDNWSYRYFVQSPTEPNEALYLAEDKHFRGCSCYGGRQKRYLGVVDLETGERRRLTRQTSYQVRWPSWSPGGRRIAYLRTSFHDIDNPVTWSKLHVIRPDGTGDRYLIDDVRRKWWVSPTRLVVGTGPAPKPRGRRYDPQQLREVNAVTGTVHRLTTGYFHHELTGVHGRRYLVVERPVGGSRFQGNMWIVGP